MEVITVFHATYQDNSWVKYPLPYLFSTNDKATEAARRSITMRRNGKKGSELTDKWVAVKIANGLIFSVVQSWELRLPQQSMLLPLDPSGQIPEEITFTGLSADSQYFGVLTYELFKNETFVIWNGNGDPPKNYRVVVEIENVRYELDLSCPRQLDPELITKEGNVHE